MLTRSCATMICSWEWASKSTSKTPSCVPPSRKWIKREPGSCELIMARRICRPSPRARVLATASQRPMNSSAFCVVRNPARSSSTSLSSKKRKYAELKPCSSTPEPVKSAMETRSARLGGNKRISPVPSKTAPVTWPLTERIRPIVPSLRVTCRSSRSMATSRIR